MTEKEKQVQRALGLLNKYRVSLFDVIGIPHEPPLPGFRDVLVETTDINTAIRWLRKDAQRKWPKIPLISVHVCTEKEFQAHACSYHQYACKERAKNKLYRTWKGYSWYKKVYKGLWWKYKKWRHSRSK